jgi:RimJ/RimL family protein N-acetyltransferase
VGDSLENITALKRALYSLSRPSLGLLGIKVIRFKRKIENYRIRLRLLRIKDLYALRSRYWPEHLRGVCAGDPGLFWTLFFFWRRLRLSFQALYLVEIKSAPRDPMIGFVGLYSLEIGRSLYVSAVLFDPEDRRKGYGRIALTLLFDFLKEAAVAKEVRAEVFRSNPSSLAFLQTLGFEVLADQGDQLLLVKPLDQGIEPVAANQKSQIHRGNMAILGERPLSYR